MPASVSVSGQGVLQPYVAVLRIAPIRHAMLVGALSRIPNFAISVLLTLHIVQRLDPSYSAAGLVAAVFTIAATVSSPWRGHLLDTLGLRRTMLPSLVIVSICIALAPVMSYWWLLVVMVPLGLMSFPTFSVLRQVMVANAPDDLRRTAMSLDSVVVEFCYMAGPTLGVIAATRFDTRLALWIFGAAWVVGSAALTWLNPPITRTPGESTPANVNPQEQAALDLAAGAGRRARTGSSPLTWLSPGLLALIVAVIGAGFVLGGTDLSTVAGLRTLGHPEAIGWQLAIWGLGSAIGGTIHGALPRPIPVVWLLALLGATTIPLALAGNLVSFGVLLGVTGLFCAPTLAASAELISRQVPERFLGQAMGWHGAALSAGVAVAPPLVGSIMDAHGWPAGFVLTGGLGAMAAAALLLVRTLRRLRLA